MSAVPELRRADKALDERQVADLLAHGFCGRLASVGADGWPYVTPWLYVWMEGRIWVHNANAPGHLRTNVEADPRICFEIDAPGQVFAYGRSECDTSVAYRSVVAFGAIRLVEDRAEKQRFCAALMAKYGSQNWDRPRNVFPRLARISVYAITIERMTGKANPLPSVGEQWPAIDRPAFADPREDG